MFTRRYTNFWDGLFRPSKTHLLGSGEVKTLTNLVTNGDFSNGTTGWTVSYGAISVANNTATITCDGTYPKAYLTMSASPGIIGHVYAVTCKVRCTNNSCLSLQAIRAGGTIDLQVNPVQNQWYQKTVLVTGTTTAVQFYVVQTYANAAAALGQVMEVQYVSCVDLTAAFGAGNEPSQTDYANWIATQSNSWFNTTAQYLCNTNQWF